MGENIIVGVQLIGETPQKDSSTCLGVVLVTKDEIKSLNLHSLRERLQQQLPALMSSYAICSPQGWQLSCEQEKRVTVDQVLTKDYSLLIQKKFEKTKVGIKTKTGHPIGFVFADFKENINRIRETVYQQVLQFKGLPKTFQFLDPNGWPVSVQQEGHLTVLDILFGSCLMVDVELSSPSRTVEFSPPDRPPYKRLKGCKELSFGSSKDVDRQVSVESVGFESSAKQILLSYVRAEAAQRALDLKLELSALGYSVYLDVHEIQTGVDWQDSLNFAVSNCEVFVPLVTSRYGETQWTNREVKLADVLGKYILPVSFIEEWPPPCLAIQFATTQFLPWRLPGVGNDTGEDVCDGATWKLHNTERIASQIGEVVSGRGRSLNKVPSLTKRQTILKSCACVKESNPLALTSDREGRPLVVVCIHPSEQKYGEELKTFLESEKYEVWCTTQLEIDYPDSLQFSSQDSVSPTTPTLSSSELTNIHTFQEKADESGVVIVVLSQNFAKSKTCQQQVFYCEHRKRVIPLRYEEFTMPTWMRMLIGTKGFENVQQDGYKDSLVCRIKRALDPNARDSPGRQISEARINCAVEKIRESLNADCSVYIAGSTKFYNPASEAICRSIGTSLAALEAVTMVTGGFFGVGETIGRAFYEETQRLWKTQQIWHILPEKDSEDRSQQAHQNKDGTFKIVQYGKTLFCGDSVRERETIAARAFDICILVEGGPGAAHEAEEFAWNDHIVVPVRCTGGAAGGNFNVPQKIFEVPPGVQETDWHMLSSVDATPAVIGQAVANIVQNLMNKLTSEESFEIQAANRGSQVSQRSNSANKRSPARNKISPLAKRQNVTANEVSPPRPNLCSMKTVIL